MRAVELYNAFQGDEDSAQQERQRGAAQGMGDSQQGHTRRIIQRGPVTFEYSFGGTNEGSDESFGGQEGHEGHPGVDPNTGLDFLNLSMAMMDRDFTDEDYEMLRILDRNELGQGQPVPQETLDTLPQHTFHSREQPASNPSSSAVGSGSSGVSAYHQALQDKYGGSRDRVGDTSSLGSSNGPGGSSSPGGSNRPGGNSATAPQLRRRCGALRAGTTADQGLGQGQGGDMCPSAPPQPVYAASPAAPPAGRSRVRSCSICLEDFAEGEQVTSLPCFHQFHSLCVQPWLRQQGRNSTCPECKTLVF